MVSALRMRSLAGSRGLPPLPFSGEEPLLRLAQRRAQLRISTVIGQQEDLAIRLANGVRNWLIRRIPLPPMRPRLQPEDDRRDVACLRGSEQIAGDRRIGFRYPAIEFIAQPLAQGLRRAADDSGDVILPNTNASQMPHPLAHRLIHGKCLSRHGLLLIDRGAACRRARRTTGPKPDAMPGAR